MLKGWVRLHAIDVVVDKGIVTLTGTAASHEIQEAAQEIAEEQDGVLEVINDVKLGGESSPIYTSAAQNRLTMIYIFAHTNEEETTCFVLVASV